METAINDQLVAGTNARSTFDYLSWELTEEWNFGLTSYLADGRLNLEADYFIRDTRNAAIPVKARTVARPCSATWEPSGIRGLNWS
ncbi:MAG: hypothetical protein R2751_10085 [Bacteroidales bacterium]